MRTILMAAMGLMVGACDAAEVPRPGEVRVAFDIESMWLEGVTGFTARVSQAEAPSLARNIKVGFAALERFEPFEASIDCERGDVTIEVEAVAGECEQPRKLSHVVACPEGGSAVVALGGVDFPRVEVTAHALSICVPSSEEYCGAKVDVVDALLFDPATGERGPTVVVGMGCVSASADAYGMYVTDVHLTCDDSVLSLPLASAPIGDGAPYPPLLARSAKYAGFEPLRPDYTRRYLNGAWLLTPEALAATSCSVDVAFIFAPNGLPDAQMLENANPMNFMGYRVSAQFIEGGVIVPQQGADIVMRGLTTGELATLDFVLVADVVFDELDGR